MTELPGDVSEINVQRGSLVGFLNLFGLFCVYR
jgi:hypothetical protein